MTTKLKAKSPEVTEPGKIKGLIYGASGVGKTWFTLSFPKPYYFDVEGGADLKHYQNRLKESGGVYLGPQDGALDFSFIIDQIKALATEKHEHKTLIIDSITKIYQTCIANEAERLGDKDAFGASKKPAVQNMRRLVSWIMKLDMNVWFVSHEATEWGTGSNGQRQEIGKMADVWDKLIYELDLTLQAVKRGPDRIAIVKKSRLTGFPDSDYFPLDYKPFAERYGKDFIESASKPIVLASDKDVSEVNRLLEIVKVSQDEIDKWWTKASVTSFSEMTEDQIQKVIKYLQAKLK